MTHLHEPGTFQVCGTLCYSQAPMSSLAVSLEPDASDSPSARSGTETSAAETDIRALDADLRALRRELVEDVGPADFVHG